MTGISLMCVSCNTVCGQLANMTRETLTDMAKGSPYVGMMRFVPDDFMIFVVQALNYKCQNCLNRDGKDAIDKEAQREYDEREQEKDGQETIFQKTEGGRRYDEHGQRRNDGCTESGSG